MCLPFDALLQHLPSYLGFSYLGRGVSLHICSSKVQPMLFTLDEGYLLTTALPDLQRGIALLGPPVPMQPPLLGCGEIMQSQQSLTLIETRLFFSADLSYTNGLGDLHHLLARRPVNIL